MARKNTSTVKSKAAPKKPAAKKPTPVSAARKAESTPRNAIPNVKFDQTLSGAKAQLEKVGAQLFGGYEDVAQLGKENVEAVVKSSQILAKSAEQLGRAVAGFTQSSLEIGAQAGQALLGVKTLRDLVEVQSEFARNAFDHFVAGTSKISDMTVKVANEAIEPISQRMNEAIDKASKKFAA